MHQAVPLPARRRRTVRCLGALGTAVAATAVGVLAGCAALLVSAWRMAMLVVAVALGGCATLPGLAASPHPRVALVPAEIGVPSGAPRTELTAAVAPRCPASRRAATASSRWSTGGPSSSAR